MQVSTETKQEFANDPEAELVSGEIEIETDADINAEDSSTSETEAKVETVASEGSVVEPVVRYLPEFVAGSPRLEQMADGEFRVVDSLKGIAYRNTPDMQDRDHHHMAFNDHLVSGELSDGWLKVQMQVSTEIKQEFANDPEAELVSGETEIETDADINAEDSSISETEAKVETVASEGSEVEPVVRYLPEFIAGSRRLEQMADGTFKVVDSLKGIAYRNTHDMQDRDHHHMAINDQTVSGELSDGWLKVQMQVSTEIKQEFASDPEVELVSGETEIETG